MSATTQRARNRLRIALTAAAVAASSLVVPGYASTALAAAEIPDDSQLFVAEKGHVDSPKVFYQDGELTLQTEAKGDIRPIDQAVHYLGHGYTRDGDQNFIFTIPDNAPELEFLGSAGDDLFMSPMVSNLPHDPIWSGYGADTAVPIEQFRDGAFTLDLISANGPGKVELFRWNAGRGDEPGLLTRMLSTGDNDFRSALLTAGTHTHNYTTFTHPGRYELTYRATARSKDGELLASKDYTTQWQVGGNRPGAAMTSIAADSATAAAATATAANAAAPSFSIAPASGVAGADDAVADKLHTLQVTTPGVTEGTAEFTVNGFHLATVALNNGQAGVHELLPNDNSQYQVTVRDSEGKVQYTSAPIALTNGAASTTESGEPQPTVPAASEPFAANEVTFDNLDATATIAPTEGGNHRLDIKFTDPRFTGFIALNEYSSETEQVPTVTFDTVTRDGEASMLVPTSYLENGAVLKLQVTPHPLMQNTSATTATLTATHDTAQRHETTFALAQRSNAPVPTDSPSPTASTSPSERPAPSPTVPGAEPATCQDRILIDRGHLDLALIGDATGVQFKVKDDSRVAAPGSTDRDGSEFALTVPDAAKVNRSDAQQGAQWDAVLAPAGEPTWVLPFAQNQSLPWPGYSTDRVADGSFANYELHLQDATGPGDVALFVPEGLTGTPKVLLGTREGAPRTLAIEGPTHAHAGWAFTQPGMYELTFAYDAIAADGSRVSSNTQTMTLVVGSAARDAFCQQEPAATEPAAPEPAAPGATAPGATATDPANQGTPVQSNAPATTAPATTAPAKSTGSSETSATTAAPAPQAAEATSEAAITPGTANPATAGATATTAGAPQAGTLATTGATPMPMFAIALSASLLGAFALGATSLRRQSAR